MQYAISFTIVLTLSFLANNRNAVWLDVVSKSYGNARGYNNLGNEYLGKNLLKDAMRAYEIGIIYLKNGLLKRSLKNLEAEIKLRPEFSEAHYAVGMVYKKMGNMQKAKQAFDTAFKLAPGFYPSIDNNHHHQK